MFKRSTSFQVNKYYDELVSEMQHAQQNNRLPKPAVNIIDSNDKVATFSVIQQVTNANSVLIKADGSMHQISDDTTQVELSIDYLTTSIIFKIISMLVGLFVLTLLLRSVLSPILLVAFVLISVTLLFVVNGVGFFGNFRSQMDAFFGDQWRS